MQSEEKKDECPLSLQEIIDKINEYKNTGDQNTLEFLNDYSFSNDVAKVINDMLNQSIIDFVENHEYDKLSHIMDEFHRDNNILEGSVLCEMILLSIKQDNLKLLLSLLMGDYANYWNDYHMHKAWELIIENLDNNNTKILRAMRDMDYRSHIIDILM